MEQWRNARKSNKSEEKKKNLIERKFDEEQNRAEFQKALMEWRGEQSKQQLNDSSAQVQTESENGIEIQLTNTGLSLTQRLLLQKLRSQVSLQQESSVN